MSLIIGIDPGLNGALATLGWTEPFVTPVPTMKATTGKGLAIDNFGLAGQLAGHFDVATAYVESVHAMPGQGVSSMFKFGDCFGAVKQACASAGIPFVLVRPQVWKKEFDLLKKDKEAALGVVAELWPGCKLPGNKAQRQGCADALLIAEWGRRQQ